MNKVGGLIHATSVMMETNRIAASGADKSADARAERELEERRQAVEEKFEAANSGILGGIVSGIIGLVGVCANIGASFLGWVGQANAANTFLSEAVDKAATACAITSAAAGPVAQLAKAPFESASAFEQAEASRTELDAEVESRAKQAAERRSDRAREENRQAGTTLLEQMTEYNNARKFV